MHSKLYKESSSIIDCTGANEGIDPLEDEDVKHLWSWELRDVKVLPKAQRQQAQALKKSLLKVPFLLCTLDAIEMHAICNHAVIYNATVKDFMHHCQMHTSIFKT